MNTFDINQIYHQAQLSPENEFSKFLRTIVNEIQSPVLEKYDDVYITHFTKMIEKQKNEISSLKQLGDLGNETLTHCQIYEMEIQRIEYYITLYTKTRLRKIHEMALCGEKDTNKMTAEEYKLFMKYKEIRASFYEKSGLNNPDGEERKNQNKFVFVRVLVNVEQFKIHPDDEEPIELEKGDIYLLPYKSVSDFINTNTFELI